MSAPDPSIYLRLKAVVDEYAAALDRRDTARFLATFHPEGRLIVHAAPTDLEATSILDGHSGLRRATEGVHPYEGTFHFIGQSQFDLIATGEAVGQTYCLAHHLIPDHFGGENLVMHIRYAERLSVGVDGQWRFDERNLYIDWMDRRLAVTVGFW